MMHREFEYKHMLNVHELLRRVVACTRNLNAKMYSRSQ